MSKLTRVTRRLISDYGFPDKFEFVGSFTDGCTVTNRSQAVRDSEGLHWVYLGGSLEVTPGYTPAYPSWVCVGLLNSDYIYDVRNWGSNSSTGTNGIGKPWTELPDSTDAINLAGYHAGEYAKVISEKVYVYLPKGKYRLGHLTLVDATTLGLTLYRNQQYLIRHYDNVGYIGDGKSTKLRADNGLVQSTKEIGGTKGFIVFADGVRNVVNASVEDLYIDLNGDNNLMVPLNWSGAQAHCPAIACYEGSSKFSVRGVHVDNGSGANIFIFQEAQAAFNSYGTTIRDCVFYRVADAISGNGELTDHSSIRIHSDGYIIDNVSVIQPTMSDMCTAFECHGAGVVSSCHTEKARYPFLKANDGSMSKSEVTFLNNICEDAGSALVLDTIPNVTTIANFIGNVVTLRSEKQVIGYPNTAAITTQQPSVLTANPETLSIYLNVTNNVITQKTRNGDWSVEQLASNVAYDVDGIKEINSSGNVFTGLWGVARLGKQRSAATIDLDDKFIKCGVNGSPQLPDNTAIRYTNKFANDYLVHLSEMRLNLTMVKCAFGGLLGLLQQAAGTTVGIAEFSCNVVTDRWMHPMLGIAPVSAQSYTFNMEVNSDVNTSAPMAGYAGVSGTIKVNSPSVPYVKEFYKYKPLTQSGWWFKGLLGTSTSDIPVRPFGNVAGDRYDVIAGAGGVIGYQFDGNTGSWQPITR